MIHEDTWELEEDKAQIKIRVIYLLTRIPLTGSALETSICLVLSAPLQGLICHHLWAYLSLKPEL